MNLIVLYIIFIVTYLPIIRRWHSVELIKPNKNDKKNMSN